MLISEGEGLLVEFKRHFSSPEKIAKEMIAFANTKGGTILFGVDDDGSVYGLQSEKSELSEIEHTSQFLCDPPIVISCDIIPWSGKKDIIAVTVPPSMNKPHTLIEYDAAGKRVASGTRTGFVRVKDKSLQASTEVMKVMRAFRTENVDEQLRELEGLGSYSFRARRQRSRTPCARHHRVLVANRTDT